MDSRIKIIQQKIDELSAALQREYARLAEKYGFSFKRKKVVFVDASRKRNKAFRIPAWRYLIPQNVKHLLSLPFIYSMIIPSVILDAFITLYQTVAFPLCGIPRVKHRDYIVFDRQFLDYLNWVQKVHCVYCTYVNGLFAYSVEIAGRTERYWCPIKAARKPRAPHSWYPDFADYGNPEEWNQKFNNVSAFNELKKEKKNEKEDKEECLKL